MSQENARFIGRLPEVPSTSNASFETESKGPQNFYEQPIFLHILQDPAIVPSDFIRDDVSPSMALSKLISEAMRLRGETFSHDIGRYRSAAKRWTEAIAHFEAKQYDIKTVNGLIRVLNVLRHVLKYLEAQPHMIEYLRQSTFVSQSNPETYADFLADISKHDA